MILSASTCRTVFLCICVATILMLSFLSIISPDSDLATVLEGEWVVEAMDRPSNDLLRTWWAAQDRSTTVDEDHTAPWNRILIKTANSSVSHQRDLSSLLQHPIKSVFVDFSLGPFNIVGSISFGIIHSDQGASWLWQGSCTEATSCQLFIQHQRIIFSAFDPQHHARTNAEAPPQQDQFLEKDDGSHRPNNLPAVNYLLSRRDDDHPSASKQGRGWKGLLHSKGKYIVAIVCLVFILRMLLGGGQSKRLRELEKRSKWIRRFEPAAMKSGSTLRDRMKRNY